MAKKIKKSLPGFWLACTATLVAFVVVSLGAYTRLVHAGLGCPDWPGCYGFFTVPETPSMMHLAELRFPGVSVDPSKGWAEMIHRYAAGCLILLVILLNVNNFLNKKNKGQPVALGLWILGIIMLQALFGMWTVTLKLWPQVVTAHLMGGFITLSMLLIMTLKMAPLNWSSVVHIMSLKRTQIVAVISMVIVFLQIVLGGWLSANYAAMACPDFPTCQGSWWPTMDFLSGFNFSQSIGPDYLGGQMDSAARTAIHFSHRIGAIIVTACLLLLCYVLVKDVYKSEVSEKGTLSLFVWPILAVLLIQLILGMSNVIFYMPLSVAVLHNLGGACLLLILVALNYRLFLKN